MSLFIKSRNQSPKKSGFTLIELLVAMGIMAVLTGMAAFNFNQSRIRARDVQRKNDLSQLQKGLELYRNDNNGYPATDYQNTLKSPNKYINASFTDPKALEWLDYQYYVLPGNKSYYLMACLENPSDVVKTTDTALCDLFTDETTDPCRCGHTSNTRTGVMYIISQP